MPSAKHYFTKSQQVMKFFPHVVKMLIDVSTNSILSRPQALNVRKSCTNPLDLRSMKETSLLSLSAIRRLTRTLVSKLKVRGSILLKKIWELIKNCIVSILERRYAVVLQRGT
jgi:hypothetical protein